MEAHKCIYLHYRYTTDIYRYFAVFNRVLPVKLHKEVSKYFYEVNHGQIIFQGSV